MEEILTQVIAEDNKAKQIIMEVEEKQQHLEEYIEKEMQEKKRRIEKKAKCVFQEKNDDISIRLKLYQEKV